MERGRKTWQWCAGGGAILLFVVLLAIRLEIPAKFRSGGGETIAPVHAGPPAGETWMSITQGGGKIGYAQRIYEDIPDGFRFSEHIFMKINTMGITQPLTVRTLAELKPDRTLSNFRFDLSSNLFKFTAGGSVSGKNLTVRIGSPGEERISVIPLQNRPFLGGAILESAVADGLAIGEERSFPVFDPASLGQRTARVILLGEEPIMIMGKSRTARKLSVDFMGMKQTAWIGPDGSVLREEGIMGIALERVAKGVALAGLEGAVSADLTELAAVPSSKPIADAEALNFLEIRLDGLRNHHFALDGGRQHYRNGVLTVRRESRDGAPVRKSIPAKELMASLEPTALIQSDNPKVRQKVAEIVLKGDSSEVMAKKMVTWIHDNLEKRPVLSVPNALETLQNRIGDCNEHAVLLAAFARAAGIPAEVEAGVVYMRGRFYYHAWNILYLRERGGWVTADAVLGQIPADVTHIRFVRGESEHQLDLVGLIGQLKIDILETGR
ncbi:MAG: transglutaminase-like domain-containing protein [Deltaproteobacteria bacterium]|nr:transglutaminase-like domain-containing protein [Deltaproteobacteria bacterium]